MLTLARITPILTIVVSYWCLILPLSLLLGAEIAATNGALDKTSEGVTIGQTSKLPMTNKNISPNPSRKFAKEHKRRVEYSKPGKSLVGWVKNYGPISRRSRRSLSRHRLPGIVPTFMHNNLKRHHRSRPLLFGESNHPISRPSPTFNYTKAQQVTTQQPQLPPSQPEIQPELAIIKQPTMRPSQPVTTTTTTPPTTTTTKQSRFPPSRQQLEHVLDVPGVTCGKVPLFEKLYHRSINESYEIDPNTGEFRILHGLDAVVYILMCYNENPKLACSSRGEWPWIVRIMECVDSEFCSTCTGTLLNDRWIITAGHCAFNQTTHPEKYSATFGMYDLVSPETNSFTLPIEKMIVHPDYRDLNNDLTLIKLAKPVHFDDMIAPACLIRATRNVIDYAKGKRCYAVGYGLTDGMEDAIKLQKLEIRAKQPSECNSYELGGVQLKSGTVCIGPPPGKMGSSCKGDSGGPNLCYDPKIGSWYIIATVSYGPANCDRENGDSWLTVSVDLSNYRTWILSTILANT